MFLLNLFLARRGGLGLGGGEGGGGGLGACTPDKLFGFEGTDSR